jgi:hypothetical protein
MSDHAVSTTDPRQQLVAQCANHVRDRLTRELWNLILVIASALQCVENMNCPFYPDGHEYETAQAPGQGLPAEVAWALACQTPVFMLFPAAELLREAAEIRLMMEPTEDHIGVERREEPGLKGGGNAARSG